MSSVSQVPKVHLRREPVRNRASAKRCVLRFCAKPGPVVVGVGGVGIDYLASVLMFPKPDQKLRTERLEAQGGGNCGNCLTATSRLGLSCRVVSTVGTDSLGDAVVSEFKADGVSTRFLTRQKGAATPFTYIIVDESGTNHLLKSVFFVILYRIIHWQGCCQPKQVMPARFQSGRNCRCLICAISFYFVQAEHAHVYTHPELLCGQTI